MAVELSSQETTEIVEVLRRVRGMNYEAAHKLDRMRAERNAAAQRAEQAEAEVAELRQQLERERATGSATEAETKPSHLLAIAALLELLKSPVDRPRPQGMNQEAIKAAILEGFNWRGLSDRNLQTIFAAANKAKADAG